ncbi:M24 family metallopeptidase [Paludisphaera rhizosphaerae]|uniref:M24 family metallopeptidase n=1 Tax=Paludisphaera rhizosphaerae TaxID=2711216 RepID=UPI0013EE08F8|nr:M24 family metallopeptidase [Paludisphaera rhizosphaerae]
MSTELYIGAPVGFVADEVVDAEVVDRILETAADRPSKSSLPAVPDPASDHGDVERKRRREDVDLKHDRIREFLDRTNQDAVVLGKSDSVAWFTSGGELAQEYWSDNSSILLFINRDCRAVIADNVQSCRVFEEELAGLGFQLKERPWFDDPDRVVAELCHNKRYATDMGSEGCTQWRRALDPLRDLRRRLTPLERQRLRELGRTLSLAVEATCRNFDRGEREADVAGHLAHRLIREGVAPVDLRVVSDDRLNRYRQPTFKAEPILKRATITVTGRRHGICASVTRSVSFGPAEEDFRANHTLAAMVDATCIYFSRPEETVSEVFRRARRIYEKFNAPHEWTLDYQGVLIGYSPREALLTPDSTLKLEPNMAVCWNPSVGSARSEDTIVVDSRGFEVVTAAQQWPQVEVCVKGYLLPRPGILER